MSFATVMGAIGLVFLFAIMIVALVLVFIGLPGNWIVFAEAVVYALITSFESGIGWWTLAALLVMSGVAELFEFLITAYGAKRYGASKSAIAGAIVGAITGAILMAGIPPVIGAFIGAFIGAYLGAFLVSYLMEKDFDNAIQVAKGAFVGKVGASLTKGIITVGMASLMTFKIVSYLLG